MFGKKKDFSQGTYDYLIVGLGNPGAEYENTRHNMGFIAISRLADSLNSEIKKIKFKSLIGEGKIGEYRCLLCKPQTFMNNSGEAVRDIMQFYKLNPEQIIIFSDDISLDVGKLRIRRKGSDGGHNGIKNIIYLTGSDDYKRIKIGVGQKPHPDYDLAAWVLGKFKKEDAEAVSKVIDLAVDAAKCIVTDGVDKAMNKYNR